MANGLTDKQACFVDEYLIDLNAAQAAMRAGYSPRSARNIAHELMHKPAIRDQIDAALADRSRRTGVNADRVLRELARIAFIDPVDLIDEDARIKSEATRDDRAAIAGVRVKRSAGKDGESVDREVKLVDKNKALELLGKHLAMFSDRLQVDASAVVKIVDDIPGGEPETAPETDE